MASPSVQVGTGTTITFDSGFFAEITNVDWSGISREAIETTHMASTAAGAGEFGAKTFKPAVLSDPGELTVEMHFNPDTIPPIDGAAETLTVTFPSGATWACSAFMTGYEPGDPLEEKMTATATIKFSGNVTVTAAA